VSRDEGLGFLGSGLILLKNSPLRSHLPNSSQLRDMLEELMSGLIRKFTDDYLRVRGGGAAGGVGGEIENVSHRFHPSARFFAANSQ
jgi:hypothetical protein